MKNLQDEIKFPCGLSMKNRFMLAPLTNTQSHEDGVLSDDEFNYWKKAFEANVVQSLDTAYNEYSILFASKDDNPESSLQNKELKNQIKEALGVLNQREALVAQLYYVEELNVYEIAEVLEISTGRISQIKKSIIGKLRNEINTD